MGSIDARVYEASVDLCRLVQEMSTVTRQAANIKQTDEMLDPRPVGVAFGRGQQAYQAAGQASDLQTSGGDDRVGHARVDGRRVKLVRKRVKILARGGRPRAGNFGAIAAGRLQTLDRYISEISPDHH